MDYTSLDEITKTIIDILQDAVDPSNTINVLPELLTNESLGVGFYLYHVQENNYYKNYPSPGQDTPPVNYNPMGLNLFYQLSANWKDQETEDAYEEQILMSLAMKALHDNAVILQTSPTITNPSGKSVSLKITMQTLTPSESVQYWAASDSSVRLSAYYEVSVVFLQPEISKIYAGRVLSYNNYIFVRGTPQIISSQNIIQYNIPGDPVTRQVQISPAQAPADNTIPAPIDSVISFTGTGFGPNAQLLINSPIWAEPAVATAAWLVTLASQNQLNATMRETATLQTALTVVNIIPGLYSAQVAVPEVITLPDLTTKTFIHTSNQFPFSVMPRIDNINPLSGVGGATFTITGYLFVDAGINPDNIQIYIGEQSLTYVSSGGITAGEFEVTAVNTLTFMAPLILSTGLVPVRVLVNGIESPPNWITGL